MLNYYSIKKLYYLLQIDVGGNIIMKNEKLIDVLKSKGIITQQDTRQLIMRSSVNILLNELKKEWGFSSDLKSGGHFIKENNLADIYFIYDTSIYDATTAIDEAKNILID